MNFQTLLTSPQDSIYTITINRESKLNALNKQTLEELHSALLHAVEDKNIRCIILTGAGTKAFVAGADIAELKGLDQAAAYSLASEAQSGVFNLITQSTKPVIAAINGFALGGGLELALACQIRIASENSRLGFPEVTLGLIPGYGGTQRLPQLIGKGKAFEMILTGEMIAAKEAFEIGLINHVVPQGQALTKATEIAYKLCKRSSTALSAAIIAINASDDSAGYQVEISEFSKCFLSNDFAEGTEAFLQKREPSFK